MKKIKYSEITPEKIYNNRRSFIKSIGFSASSIAITSLPFVNNALGNEQDQLTSYKDITTKRIIDLHKSVIGKVGIVRYSTSRKLDSPTSSKYARVFA